MVVLIGGIVAFAASRILGGGDRAKVNLAKAQVQTLADKIQQYEGDTGTLPGSLGDLVKAPGGASGWLGRMPRSGNEGSVEPPLTSTPCRAPASRSTWSAWVRTARPVATASMPTSVTNNPVDRHVMRPR